MPLPRPPTPPAGESSELAALRASLLRGTPEQTLLVILRNDLDYAANQGLDGGRVTFVGSSLHAGLFASAVEVIRSNNVTQQQLDDVRAAALAVRTAKQNRDALLAALPIDIRRRIIAEAE
jgi:hypothetical protein